MGLQKQRASPSQMPLESPGFGMERDATSVPRDGKSHPAACIHLCVDTAGEQTIMGENTIMEDKPRQENVFRVHSPLSKEPLDTEGNHL